MSDTHRATGAAAAAALSKPIEAGVEEERPRRRFAAMCSALNFFNGRPEPLRYDIFIPGYLTPSDERAAIARLQSIHTRYIFE